MIITDIFPTDSCYFYTACHGTVMYTESEVAFGKLDLDGTIVFQNTYAQFDTMNFPNRTLAQMQLNFRGNFIITHSSVGPDGWFPRLMEISPSGQLVNDFRLNFAAPDSITMGTDIFINHERADSTYDIVTSYRYTNHDNNPPGPEYSKGTILMKLNQFGDTLWTKKFHTSQSLNGNRRYTPVVFQEINDTTNLLVCREYKIYSSLFQESNNWSKMHFLWLNKNGDILTTKSMQQTQVCFGGHGFLQLEDSSMIYVYDDSYLVPYNPSTEVFRYIPLISRLDADLNLVWKDTLTQKSFPNLGAAGELRKIQRTEDGSMVYAYNKATFIDTSAVFLHGYTYNRLGKRATDGTVEWNRNFFFYPDTAPETSPGGYEIFDIELTSDGGIIVAGKIRSNDSMYAQVPFEFGYILKTNCLGFVGPPSAAVQFQNVGEMNVQFVNTSTQGGSFEWYLGDGTHFTLGEGHDTILYKYETFGPHHAYLVAHGCNGETDTVFFEVNPVYHFDPSPITQGQGHFSIFPNPVLSGKYLFVYLSELGAELENPNLRIISSDGKLVYKFDILSTEGNHWLPVNMGAGVYFANLFDRDKLIQKRKFIVQ
jgi:hypothetical protein